MRIAQMFRNAKCWIDKALTGGWPRASRFAVGGPSSVMILPLAAIILCSSDPTRADAAHAALRANFARNEKFCEE
jgi:hypothetical protein